MQSESNSILIFYNKDECISSLRSVEKKNLEFIKVDSQRIQELKYIKKPSIFIFSFDFYLKNKSQFQEIFQHLPKEIIYFLVLIYQDQELNKLYKVDFNFDLVIEERASTTLLPQWIDSKIDNLKKSSHYKSLSESLLNIGVAISESKDTIELLNKILIQSMEITSADAGSIGLVGFDQQLQRADEKLLTFYTSFNYSKKIEFSRFSLNIDYNSLAGYSLLSKNILRISDAYEIGEDKKYKFNRNFDKKTGFRTKSLLVVPMLSKQKNVLGMIQLINKKKDYKLKIDYSRKNFEKIISFDESDESNMISIANFAHIALENAILYKEIEQSFENFVRASVYAVEQRDPATSGHSDRVAGYCVKLAEACNIAKGELENFNFTRDELKELRYAALLHDFGKIGVREKVLSKQKKLESYQIKDINRKFQIYLLQQDLQAEKEKVELIKNKNLSLEEFKKKLEVIEEKLRKEYQHINDLLDQVIRSNEPTILQEESNHILKEANQIAFELNHQKEKLLSDEEFEFLQIQKGSLSEKERKEIESHVTHSFRFLERIPWGKSLQKVPLIAHGHHEKLDGSGYPLGKSSNTIMPQTKIMTVSDIFDALVASDRPYKKAMSHEKALNILKLESDEGKIDKRLVDLMIRSKTYQLFKKS